VARVMYDRSELSKKKANSLYARYFRGIMPRSIVNIYNVILHISKPKVGYSDGLLTVYFDAIRYINVCFFNYGSFGLDTGNVVSSDSSLRSARAMSQLPIAVKVSSSQQVDVTRCDVSLVGAELHSHLMGSGFPIYSLSDHLGLDVLMSGQIPNGMYLGLSNTKHTGYDMGNVMAISRKFLMWQIPCAVPDRLQDSVENQLLLSSYLPANSYMLHYLPIGMVDTEAFLASFRAKISESAHENGGFNLTPEEIVSVSAVLAYRDMRDQLDSVGAVPALVRVPFDDHDRTAQVPSYRSERPFASFKDFVASIGPVSGFGNLLGCGCSFSCVSSEESASIRSSTAFYYALGRVVVFSRSGMESYLARLNEAKIRFHKYRRETSKVYLPVRKIKYDPKTDWSPVIRNMDEFFDRIKYTIVAMNYIVKLHRYLRLLAHESFLHRIHSGGKTKRYSGGKINVDAEI
jgi:hypothetical protein